MLRLILRSARTPWIVGGRSFPIHLRPLCNVANKALLPSSLSSDLVVSYLMNSCGLSQSVASSIANKTNLFKKTKKANSVLSILRAYGFTTSHVAIIVSRYPRVLFTNTKNILEPKLEFFLDVGVSRNALVKLITSMPSILKCSLEKKLRPNFEKIKTICGGNNALLTNPKRFACLLRRNLEKELYPNLKSLQDHGVPPSSIVKFSILAPQALLRKPAQFSTSVVSLKEMGFDPSSPYFIYGLKAIWMLSKASWENKFQLYLSLGFSAEEIISAFKRFPAFMIISEEKIKRAFGVFSERLNWTPSFVATQPVLLSYSVEKTVVPRHNVMNILASKGLKRKKLSMTTILRISEKNFCEKYVMKYKDQAPEVLEAYKDKLASNFPISAS